MKKSIFKTTLALVIAITAFSCTETKTNRELFEEYLDKNIEVAMKPFIDKGVDSIAARSYMTCAFETIYQIDSTSFLKEFDEFKEIVNQNDDKLQKCERYLPSKDSLRNARKAALKESMENTLSPK